MYYTLLSLRKAARALKDQFGIQDADVTPETIRKWLDRYTDAAIRLVRDLKTPSWELWWNFIMGTFDMQRCWGILLDDRTGYIFENYVNNPKEGGLSNPKEGGLAIRKYDGANTSATDPAKTTGFYVGKELDLGIALGAGSLFPSYGGIKWLYYQSAQDVEGKSGSLLDGLHPKASTNSVPPAPGSTGTMTPVKFGARLAGWVITRNWFTTQTELGGHTPGEAAGIKSPIASWADVVRLEARAFLPTVDPKAPVATRHPSKEPASEGDCGSQG